VLCAALVSLTVYASSRGARAARAEDMTPVPCTSTMFSSDVAIVSATYLHNGHRYPISTWVPGPAVGPNSAWYYPEVDPNPVSLDGSMKWVGASLLVACYEVPYIGIVGLHVPYFIVMREGGHEVPTSLACNDPTAIAIDVSYDPSDPYGGSGGSCTSGDTNSGGGSSPGGNGNCDLEYVYIEVSDDGGATWTIYWEGYATVCQ
jgi:hypothetical protein